MISRLGLLLAGAAFVVGTGSARAQDATAKEAERAALCVPPPCENVTEYPPCDDATKQQRMVGVAITSISTADGPEVRPLGGVITGPPEIAVCARRGDESFQLYVPAINEPVLRLGMLSVLNVAMQSRAPVDISYGLPNGALRKIEGLTFGANNDAAFVRCGYGDFDRCDTSYQTKADAQPVHNTGRVTRVHLIGYGKGSRAVQIDIENKARLSFLIDPSAAPERFLQQMNLAFTAQLTGMEVEIVSKPGLPPVEAQDKSPVPALALDITLAAIH